MSKSHFKHEVPLDLHAPLPECAKGTPVEPVQRRKACNCGDIDCIECYNAGIYYADYLHLKRMNEL